MIFTCEINYNLITHMNKTLNNHSAQNQSQILNKSSVLLQATLPTKGHQLDNYEGPVDPQTRRRHGQGTYRYSNKFYTYVGNYSQGIKEGKGILYFKDGTQINGTFVNNQLQGPAEIKYSDGSIFKGELKNGMKQGLGNYISKIQEYEGQFHENMRHGKGRLTTKTTTIVGTFLNNKPDGEDIHITKYNYEYVGGCVRGAKQGKGKQKSSYLEDDFQYQGDYKQDKFNGEGTYQKNGKITYRYVGQFVDGKPKLYPNCFRVLYANSLYTPEATEIPIESYTSTQQPIKYQLEQQNQINLIIQCCYQAPEQLDPNQPTEQQIEKMVKDWQNQNKKNKNPPPMPDFRQPRMIMPELVVVGQQSLRDVSLKLIRSDEAAMKIDYREEIKKRRSQIMALKAQNAKKTEQQNAKKGAKPGKVVEPEYKVNAYVQNLQENQKQLIVKSQNGKAFIQKLEFPDDFPIGNYTLAISSPFQNFGSLKQIRKPLTIKQKNVGKKK